MPAPKSVSKKSPSEIVAALWVEGWENGNEQAFDEFVDPSCVNYASSFGRQRGPDSLRIPAMMFRKAFSHVHFQILSSEEISNEKSTLVEIIVDMESTFSGPGAFMGLLPNGAEDLQNQFHRFEVQNDKITAHWAWRDDLGFIMRITGAESIPDLLSGQYARSAAEDPPEQDFTNTNK